MPPQYTKILCICPVCSGEFYSRANRIAAGRGKYCSEGCKHLADRIPAPERFWSKVDKSAGPLACWLWLAAFWGSTRYGKFGPSHGECVLAHRYSWELAHGPIPEGIKVLHKCDNPQCVNPAHLFLGTSADNSADMVNKGRNKRGERHPNAKLSNEDVRAIRDAASRGVLKSQLARHYGVSQTTLGRIVNRKMWVNIP